MRKLVHSGRPSPFLSCSLSLFSYLVNCRVREPQQRGHDGERPRGGADLVVVMFCFIWKKELSFPPPVRSPVEIPALSFPSFLLLSPPPSPLSLSLSLCPSSHHPVRRLDPRLPDRGQSSSEPDRAKGQGPEQRRSDGEENCGAADAAVERPEVRLPEPVLEFLFRTCKERGDRERRHRGQNGRNTREQRGRKATAFSSSSHIIARTSASSSSSFPFFFFYLVLVDSPRPGHHGRGGPALPRRVRPQQ